MVKKIVSILSANITLQVLGVLSGVVLARYLGPKVRGEWAIILFYPSLLANTATLGLDTYVSRKIVTKSFDKIYLSKLLVCYAVVAGCICTFSLCLYAFWSYDLFTVIQECIYIVSFGIIFGLLSLLLISAELGFGNIKNYNLGRSIFSFGYVPILVLLYFSSLLNLYSLSITYLLLNILTAVVLLHLQKINTIKFNALGEMQSLVKNSLPYWLSSVTLSLFVQGPLLFVIYFKGAETVGYFTVALTVSSIHSVIGNTIGKVLLSSDTVQEVDTNNIVLKIMLFSYVVLFVLLYMSLPFLIKMVYGMEYYESINMMYYLLPFTCFNVLCDVLDEKFKALGIWELGVISRIVSFICLSGLVLYYGFNLYLFLQLLVILEAVRFVLLLSCRLYFENQSLRSILFLSKNEILFVVNRIKSMLFRV